MKLNLFSIPIWIANIDASKIKLKEQNIKQSFASKVNTTIDNKTDIDEESLNYIYQTVVNMLKDDVLPHYKLNLEHIWTNYYKDSDFQENHSHAGSHLSFIIYKKIQKSNVVFMNPNSTVLEAYYPHDQNKINFLGGYDFTPQCRQNQIILFPSYLGHYVKKTSDAVTIAGNLYMNFE
tara:strand:- start:35 stop:568 length:534 start_codon:yes stop_codon:yes gene_type:complete